MDRSAMQVIDVAVGLKFVDHNLTSQPEEYRVHVVTKVKLKQFTARHVASGSVRTFEKTPEALDGFELVPYGPILASNLDCFVGERVYVELNDGSAMKATVTAIRYAEILLAGLVRKYVAGIEFDRSGSTTYSPSQIASIVEID